MVFLNKVIKHLKKILMMIFFNTICKFWINFFGKSDKRKLKLWGIERSGFFNDRGKWVKGFESQRV